jgi:hypothetical protein
MDEEWEQLKATWSAQAAADEREERAEAWIAHAQKRRGAARRAVWIEIGAGVLVVAFYLYQLIAHPTSILYALAAISFIFLAVYFCFMWRVVRATGELGQGVEAHVAWLRRQLEGERRWFGALRWMSLAFTVACLIVIFVSLRVYTFPMPELAWVVAVIFVVFQAVMWWHCNRKSAAAQAALLRLGEEGGV